MKKLLVVSTTSSDVLRAAKHIGLHILLMYDSEINNQFNLIDEQIWIDPHNAALAGSALSKLSMHEPIHGVLTTDERAVPLGAKICEALKLPGHPYKGAYAARNKFQMRCRLEERGIPCPQFAVARTLPEAEELTKARLAYPLVLKPLFGMVGQGVVRVNSSEELRDWFPKIKAICKLHDYFVGNDSYGDFILLESYMEGREISLDGLMSFGKIQWIGIFDKPHPLQGPTFEETILLTPTSEPVETRDAVFRMVEAGVRGLGLHHGPIHAELRLTRDGPRILEIAARPIGGMCGKAYSYFLGSDYYELIVRNALGGIVKVSDAARTPSGVMMLPVPRAGRFVGIRGVDNARRVPGIQDVAIVAQHGQKLEAFPFQGWYIGFILATGSTTEEVAACLAKAGSLLTFDIEEPG